MEKDMDVLYEQLKEVIDQVQKDSSITKNIDPKDLSVLSIRIPKTVHTKLKYISFKHEMQNHERLSINDLINQALKDFLEKK